MKTNSTQGNLKKYFYTGIGHIAHAGDVVQKSTKEFARRGNVTEAEGREIINRAVTEIERKYNEAVHKLIEFSNTEAAKIQTRLAKLEKQLHTTSKTKRSSASPRQVIKASGKRKVPVSGKVAHLTT